MTMTWPYAPPGWFACRYGQFPPLQYFFKFAQVTFALLVPLFFFDSFCLHLTQSDIGYWQKLSNVFAAFLPLSELCVTKREKAEKFTKNLYFAETRYSCRAPPRKSESMSSHIQIFGGDKMDNTKLHEIYIKKFSYVAWALPRYHVSLTPESDGKGVNA